MNPWIATGVGAAVKAGIARLARCFPKGTFATRGRDSSTPSREHAPVRPNPEPCPEAPGSDEVRSRRPQSPALSIPTPRDVAERLSAHPAPMELPEPWTMTHHALHRATERAIDIGELDLLLSAPDVQYPARRGRTHYWQGGLNAIVEVGSRTVITVYRDLATTTHPRPPIDFPLDLVTSGYQLASES